MVLQSTSYVAQLGTVAKSIAIRVPWIPITQVFDVGANIGQSVEAFSQIFPNSKIDAFEPIPSSFQTLEETYASMSPQIRTHRLALSNVRSVVRMTNRESSPTNAILTAASPSTNSIEVSTSTGDEVLISFGIDRISYLKIDTEGHEIQVLEGFHESLINSQVDFIQVEAGLNPENQWHVPLEAIKSKLEKYGYRIFGIIQLAWEPRIGPYLRRCDAIFISPRALKKN